MFVDLDRFKAVNDTIGHHAGDHLLQEAAERLKAAIPSGGTLARHGGDEFTVLLGEIEAADEATQIAERVLGAFERPFRLDGQEAFLSASVGITIFPDDAKDPDQLLKQADVAVLRAKQGGRNTYRFFSADLDERTQRRMMMQRSLRSALEKEEFSLHYQPIFDSSTKKMVGAEALLRWSHPTLGHLGPTEFIPVLEETGLIVPVGAWVMREVCRKMASWSARGFVVPRFAVNLSPVQIEHSNVVGTLSACLEEFNIEASRISLELTEGLLLERTETSRRVLNDLKKMGVRICIDDFGTGHASLNYLRRFPVDTLKIDRSFLERIPKNIEDVAIISAIVSLAHRLGITVIAEGVESQEQFVFLKSIKCDGLQGHLLGAAMPEAELEALFDH